MYRILFTSIITIIIFVHSFAQTQLDVQGSSTNGADVAKIKLNYLDDNSATIGLLIDAQTISNSDQGIVVLSSGIGIDITALYDGIKSSSTNEYGVFGFTVEPTKAGVYGRGSQGADGVYGLGTTGDGVFGESEDGFGVYGLSENNFGIYGASTNEIGIYGESSGSYGVYGVSSSDAGIYGESTAGRPGVEGLSINGNGVKGVSTNSDGVWGFSSTDEGVEGESTNGNGVYGLSLTGYGLRGYSNNNYGLHVESLNDYGAYIKGFSGNLLLAATTGFGNGDDSVIRTQEDLVDGDLYLISNDATVVQLDADDNSSGRFLVKNDGDIDILEMREDGNLLVRSELGTVRFEVETNGDVLVGGSTVHASDRNKKEEIYDLDNYRVLQLLEDLPIYEWQYKGQERRHIGPMAQDFHAAFGLGDDDKTIASIDADGIALAAIKAQQEIIDKQSEMIETLINRLDRLEKKLENSEDSN